jgi:hypothetical protein
MPETKPNYTELVHQVVRESVEPLPFAEILQRVNDLVPITTKNPKSTIRNAISQSWLVVNTGDGRYGWKYCLINGAVIRLPLSESDLAQHRIIYSKELRDALWPAFFESQKRRDRLPVQLQLPDGKICELTLDFLGEATWGTHGSPEVWEWLNSVGAQPGDDLLFRVIDGEARRYGVEIQTHAEREEEAIAERNRQIFQVIQAYNQQKRSIVLIWEVSSYLLATGQYKHPTPPDPLEQILKGELWGPDIPSESNLTGWMLAKEPEIVPLIASLLDQIGEAPRRRRLKKGPSPTHGSDQIYQLKVTLAHISPPIWRRIQVPGDITLLRLHAVLQITMGWTNSHLHGFRANGQFYSEPDPDFNDLKVIDERQVRLSQIAPEIGSRFVYEYDFGDSWDHELIVEKILPSGANGEFRAAWMGNALVRPKTWVVCLAIPSFSGPSAIEGIPNMANGCNGPAASSTRRPLIFKRPTSCYGFSSPRLRNR